MSHRDHPSPSLLTTSPYARLWAAIPGRRRLQLLALLALTLLASLAEVFSIGAVLPFLGVLTVPEKVYTHAYAQPLIAHLGITTREALARDRAKVVGAVATP